MLKVHRTKDLSIFKRINGNRPVNTRYVEVLKEAFKKQYFDEILIVNEKMEIIDGQHRLEAARALGFSVQYVIKEGFGLKEVQDMNHGRKNWNSDDYLQSYAERGKRDYEILIAFKEKQPFTTNICALLLSTRRGNRARIAGGKFEAGSIALAEKNARILKDFGKFYGGYVRRPFVLAVLSIMRNNNYSHAKMLKKLKYQVSKLVHCSNTEQYVDLLERIYNYKSAKKVSLKYSK